MNCLFDVIEWKDPVTGRALEPIITARNPSGVPLMGIMRIEGTDSGYPIVDSVIRLTPQLAYRYRDWLSSHQFQVPHFENYPTSSFQALESVESFGFQWTWNSQMRSAKDLRWRVADRFHVDPADFSGAVTIDAGCGAGDQTGWLLDQGAKVVSLDLSSAIDVTAKKFRMNPCWVGVQGDITALPFASDQFSRVYCEGVIQHTKDSALAVKELCRILTVDGKFLATHYDKSSRWRGRLREAWQAILRGRFKNLERFKLLYITGTIAALSHIPLVGKMLRISGTSLYYDLMPDFKSTWTNTYDFYGGHFYQRYITAEEFLSYFQQLGTVTCLFQAGTVLVVTKTGADLLEERKRCVGS